MKKNTKPIYYGANGFFFFFYDILCAHISKKKKRACPVAAATVIDNARGRYTARDTLFRIPYVGNTSYKTSLHQVTRGVGVCVCVSGFLSGEKIKKKFYEKILKKKHRNKRVLMCIIAMYARRINNNIIIICTYHV